MINVPIKSAGSSDEVGRKAMAAGARRLVVIVASLLLFGFASTLAFWQVRADQPPPYVPLITPAWWVQPLGSSPSLPRAPAAIAGLTHLIAIPGTHIWWGLRNGQIVQSQTDGEKWDPLKLQWERLNSPRQSPGKAGMDLSLLMVAEVAAPPPPLKEPDPEKIRFASLWFASEKEGYAGSTDGILIHTTDGGLSWKYALPGAASQGNSIDLIYFRGMDGVLRNANKHMWVTFDGGESWNDRASLFYQDVGGVWIIPTARDAMRLWVVGSRMEIVSHDLQNAGSAGDGVDGEIENLPSGADAYALHAITFLEGDKVGMIAGDHGILLRTTDGGAFWRVIPSGTTDDLMSVNFLDAQRGFATAKTGAVVETHDGGATWALAAAHTYPAPWYWGVCLALLIASVTFLVRREETMPAEEKSIADAMASDKPLEPGDRDPLNLANYALGVTLFLANDNTPPPLTFAVTGKWGAGKSSLMNLISGQLRQRWFRPVWFNAWHSQSEESLFANLLEAVRSQAFPSPLSLEGIRLRYRLLRHRMGTDKYRRIAFVSAGCLALLCGYAFARYEALRPTLANFPGFINGLNAFLEYLTKPDSLEAVGTLGAIVVSFVTLIRTFSHALTAFHVNPGALLASTSSSSSLKKLSAQTSFRYRFAREFKDVTETLNPDRSLLIMIDDLDRCKPDAVVQTLEAINFLVTSGDCFILVAMDRDVVEKAIAVSYKDLWQELPTADGEGKSGQSPLAFASKYLEKLFNIEVPVPNPDDADLVNLLLAPREAVVKEEKWWKRVAGMAREFLSQAVVIIAGIFFVGFVLSFVLSRAMVPVTPVVVETAATQSAHTSATSSPATGTAASTATATRIAATGKLPAPPAVMTYAGPPRSPLILAILLATAFLGIAGILIFKRPKLSVRDSDLFRDVLDLWQPIIAAKPYTPRSLKRFLNAVRFFAMRQRDPEKAIAVLGASVPLRNFFTGKPASIGTQNLPDAMMEPDLIALATLFYVLPDRMHDAAGWDALTKGDNSTLLANLPPALAKSLQEILQNHKNRWKSPFTRGNLTRMSLLSRQFH